MKGSIIFYLIISILSIILRNDFNISTLFLIIIFFIFCGYKFGKKHYLFLSLIIIFFQLYRPINKYEIDISFKKYTLQINEKNTNYCLVKDLNTNHLYLFYQQEYSVEEGQIISIKGNLNKIYKDSSLYGFEFKDYLEKKRVYYQIEYYEEFKIIKENIKVENSIIKNLTSKLDKYGNKITNMLVFNDKNIDRNAYENIKNLNVSHLFVVSGFHISFLFKFLNLIFRKLFYKYSTYFSFIILFFYLFLLNFSISALRAFLCLLFLNLDQKKHFTTLDYLGIAGLISLLIEPLNVYNYSFIMSYLATFVILLSQNILNGKNKIVKLFVLSFICFLTMIPIILSMNYKINFFSFFINLLLSNLIVIIFIMCLIGMAMPFLSNIVFEPIYKLFFNIIEKLSFFGKPLVFGNPSKLFIIIFYVLLFFLLIYLEKNKIKQSLSIIFAYIFLLFFQYNKNSFINYEQVTFLDVYQGDCTIIENKYNEGVIFIDTGGLKNYDLVEKRIMPFLDYKGIKTIDTVIISHHDYDHMGALENLIKKIPIKHIISDVNIDNFKIGNISFYNLNKFSNKYDDENNKSLVLFTKIANMKFLFTGDIDKNLEEDIIYNYPNLKIDVLKVAHHGSNSSTSENFIKTIKPSFAVISVGKNNYYSHPNIEVLNTLKKYNVYYLRTDENGSIFLTYRNNKYYLQTAK